MTFHIYAVDDNNETILLYETHDEEIAQNEVDRLNSHCANAGRPQTVYYI
jgi:hypothetical protein